MSKQEILKDARKFETLARKAHNAGEATQRDGYIREAANRYHEAGMTGSAGHLMAFLGTPAR